MRRRSGVQIPHLIRKLPTGRCQKQDRVLSAHRGQWQQKSERINRVRQRLRQKPVVQRRADPQPPGSTRPSRPLPDLGQDREPGCRRPDMAMEAFRNEPWKSPVACRC